MSDQPTTDTLAELFSLQTELNDHVFQKNDIRGSDGTVLSMEAILRQARDGKLMVNDLPNRWLYNYATAIQSELDELKADLQWKWWSKDGIDLQNVRVELVDILHFLVSAMICSGLSAEKLFDIYRQKHAINIARQNSGYNKATKSEDDNRSIT